MKQEHYDLIARQLQDCRPFIAKRSTREQRASLSVWRNCRQVLIAALQMADSNFDPDLFFSKTEQGMKVF